MVSNHLYYDAHFISEALCHTKICLSVLQTSTPHQLTAVADTHTEHNQLPHVHVHSCTCRCTVLCYTVSPYIYTRRNILNSRTVLFMYISKVIQHIWAYDKKFYFITQDYEAVDLCITRNKYFLYCCWYYYNNNNNRRHHHHHQWATTMN